jgi:hypothetical protein
METLWPLSMSPVIIFKINVCDRDGKQPTTNKMFNGHNLSAAA